MKRQIMAGLVVAGLFGATMLVGEFVPALRPYLPSFAGFMNGIAGANPQKPSPATNAAPAGRTAAPETSARVQEAVLALSWQAAFCETAPEKRECKTQKADRYDATNFALHGLWPEAENCSTTPYSNVSEKLWAAMRTGMPGTASGLHKHEWARHGTCYSDTPERYFADSLRLLVAFNKTPIRDLFEQNIGRFLTARDIRERFDAVFGRGTGDRVLVDCVRDGDRTLIRELRVRLNGDLAGANLPVLLKQARPQKQGCRGGIVDAVGLD